MRKRYVKLALTLYMQAEELKTSLCKSVADLAMVPRVPWNPLFPDNLRISLVVFEIANPSNGARGRVVLGAVCVKIKPE